MLEFHGSLLTLKQKLKRLNWAKILVNWKREQWCSVILSGETKITLCGSDGVKYIRRRIGEDMRPDCIIPTVKHPVNAMIWSCMASKL